MLKDEDKKIAKFIIVCIAGILAFCIFPPIALWVINSLSAAGGSDFYIEHNLLNYTLVFIGLVGLKTAVR